MCPGDAIYAQIMLGAMLDTGVVRRNSEPNKLDEIPQRVVSQRCCQCGCTCRGRDVEQDRLLGDDADDDSLDVYHKSHVTFSGPWWEQVRSMQCDELDSTTPLCVKTPHRTVIFGAQVLKEAVDRGRWLVVLLVLQSASSFVLQRYHSAVPRCTTAPHRALDNNPIVVAVMRNWCASTWW